METGQSSQPVKSPLQELVESFRFNKVSAGLMALPAIFASLSMVLLSFGLAQLLKLGEKMLTEEATLLEAIYTIQPLGWGFVALLGFTIASMVTTYILLRDLREHFYQSGVTTYYFTGGSNFESALQYLKSMLARSTLPAPVTGLILVFLTSGVAYPIMLCFAEKAAREHIAVEEEALFKKRLTNTYKWSNALLDIVLVILTFGLYLAYMGYRLAKIFNTHVDVVHGSHPNPPTAPLHATITRELEPSTSLLVGLFLLSIGLSALMSYIGLFVVSYVVFSNGILLSVLALLNKSKRGVIFSILLALALLYTLIVGGFLAGVVGYETYGLLGDIMRKQANVVRSMNVPELVAYIFTNNLVISLPSIIPYIGGVLLAQGGYNAGLVMGIIVSSGLRGLEEALFVLIYPHAILELSAYAVLVTSSSFLGEWGKYTKLVLVGVVLLFMAALVEALTIKYS